MRRTFFLFATLALLENNVASAADDVDELLDEVEEPKEKKIKIKREMDGSTNQQGEADTWIDLEAGKIEWMAAEDDDVIEVFYMEHVLAAWVLESAPWTAFHSGMGFHNKRTGAKYTVDYIPMRVNSVHYVLVPVMKPHYPMDTLAGKFKNWWYGHADFEWLNDGAVMFYNEWPSKYENFTKLGTVTGAQYRRYMSWAEKYNESHVTFDPVEIVVEGRDPKNASRRITADRVSSRMCHDLVGDSLWYFYDNEGVTFKADKPVYRDHIILFGSKYEEVDIAVPEQLTAVTNYFKMYYEFLPLIEKEFTNIRGMLINSEAGGLEPFLYIGKKYYRVTMADPFVNYCYMPMPMPPRRPNFFEDPSFCALETKVSTNSTRNFMQAGAETVRLAFKLSLLNPAQFLPYLFVLVGLVAFCCKFRGKSAPPAAAGKGKGKSNKKKD